MGGANVKIAQATAYPNDGSVSINVNPAKPATFSLHLRIPTWAQGEQFLPGDLYDFVDPPATPVSLKVNGKAIDASNLQNGFAVIERMWKAGDKVELNLPMPIRASRSHPSVKANVDRIALTRGPFVMCAEGIDNGGVTQRYFFSKTPDTSKAKIAMTKVKHGSFVQATIPADSITNTGGDSSATHLRLTPYYAWNNRDIGSMTVWFPTKAEMAVYDPLALPRESVFTEITASHTAAEDSVNAIGDGQVDKWSSGKKIARWTSRDQPGKEQWVVGRFHKSRSIRSVGVFWMNRREGDVKFPKEWSLEVEQGGQWKPFELYTTDRYDYRANQFNVVHPAAPTECDAIRIKMTPREETAVGILEVQALFDD